MATKADYTISPYGRATCPICRGEFSLTKKGVLRAHGDGPHPRCVGAGQFPPFEEEVRYWNIWTADLRELKAQVSNPGLVNVDAALRQATKNDSDFEFTRANSYVEETDETGFNLLLDWDSLAEDEKADLRPVVTG